MSLGVVTDTLEDTLVILINSYNISIGYVEFVENIFFYVFIDVLIEKSI